MVELESPVSSRGLFWVWELTKVVLLSEEAVRLSPVRNEEEGGAAMGTTWEGSPLPPPPSPPPTL